MDRELTVPLGDSTSLPIFISLLLEKHGSLWNVVQIYKKWFLESKKQDLLQAIV